MNQSTAVEVTQGGAVAMPQQTSLLEAISRAAADPAMDIEKMERLFAMHERMVSRQAEVEFNAALAQAQAEMTTVVKNKMNEFTKARYADLDAIINWISPIYTARGFSVSFNTEDCEDKTVLRVSATLSHSGGHSRQYRLDAPLDDTGSGGKTTKTKIQATGSTNSYARRYIICMIFNVTTADDNDGNKKESKFTMAANAITPEQREKVQKIASAMAAHLRAQEVADAVILGEQSNLDADEMTFLWTFFASDQRSAMKKVSAELRKKNGDKINDSQRKRLEARITEAGVSRDKIKAYVKEQFGKDHFSELTQEEYNRVDSLIEDSLTAGQV